MSHLFDGTLGMKRVVVFSTAKEAEDYCRTHPNKAFKAATVYAAYSTPKSKRKVK